MKLHVYPLKLKFRYFPSKVKPADVIAVNILVIILRNDVHHKLRFIEIS